MIGLKSSWVGRYSLSVFFALAFGITWIFSILATPGLLPFVLPLAVRIACGILLHWGPCLASIIVVGIVGGKLRIRALLVSLGEWRVRVQWYVFVLLFPVALLLAAVGLNALLGGILPEFGLVPWIAAGIPPMLVLVMVFVGVLFQAGLAEEIGWRGYALPKLQTHSNALISSLILGVLWGLWHFHPANWATLLPIGLWYMFLVVPMTIVFTWVYNNTKKSLLIAVLFHTSNNTASWLIPIMPELTGTGNLMAFILYTGLIWIAALILIIIFGYRRLSKEEPVTVEKLEEL